MPLTNYRKQMELFTVVGTPRCGVPARQTRAEPKES